MAAIAMPGAGLSINEVRVMLVAAKVTRIVLLLGAMLFWGVVHASATPILSVEPPIQVVQSGQSFSLEVAISNVADLYAFQFNLAFNPLVLSATDVTEGPFLPSGGTTVFIPGMIDNAGGTISSIANSLIGLIPGVSGTGTLATVDFDTSALGTSSIILSNVRLLESNFEVITSNIVNGSVSVVPEPTALLLLATAVAGFLSIGLRSDNARVHDLLRGDRA
jgi:hypothetical protein